ncbi:MAG TPA: M1 family aminopeptidase, partial [Candidatus Eisenbacteria bacterium]|nr:M1 family aminopeptidase [Candidatus Eisenbacteria bacterium]
AAAPAARAADTPDVRLGHDVVPTFEHVRLHLDPDKRVYTGSVHVELDVRRAAAAFALHADVQKLERLALVQGGETLAVTPAPGAHGLVTLTAARPLAPGPATLDVDFTNMYGTRAVGLYRVLAGGHGYVFTQFESDDARRAFPCWDEPGFKFPWQVTLEVPDGQQAVTNTPETGRHAAGGWQTIEFARTPALPSYLIAVAVGPFEFTPVAAAGVPMRIVTVQGQSRLAAYAAEIAPKLLAALERWFGTPYPFAKLDLIAVPEFAYGAMENAGAITFRDDALLLDPATATASQRRRIATVTCHEMAHMWFGDLVTMSWWDDLWLNESFADWMSGKITDEVFPDFKYGLADLQRIESVKAGDIQPSTTAIRSPTTSSAAGLANVGLVYSKGNAVLSMFERYLGADVFQRGVREYLAAHARGNATAADLWQALDHASGTDVSAAMASFTDQPGVPCVRVVPAPGGVRITQSRCSPYGVSQPPMRWRIPIALKWSDGRAVHVQRVLLAAESETVKLGPRVAWVMPDAGGHGYYDWSLPGPMLEAIAAHAAADLTPEERVAFLGNLDVLLAVGDVHGDTYLRVLAGFGTDPEPQVVTALLGDLQSVRAPLVPDREAGAFAAYVRRTLRPALDRIGLVPKPGEDETLPALRGELLSWLVLRGDDARAAAFADSVGRRSLADSTAVDPGLAEATLGLAARHGDAAMFDDLQRRFESADVPAFRSRYLTALGAFADTTLEARALAFALTDAVRPTETFAILRGAGARSEAAGARLYAWMTAHYDEIARRVPPPALRFMPLMAGGCSAERLAAAEAFFGDPARAFPGIETTLERLRDGVHACVGLREREGPAAWRYLASLGGASARVPADRRKQ